LHKDALARGLKRFQSSLPVDWVSLYFGGMYFLPDDKEFKKEVPWTDKRVRQAMNVAVNRKELLNTVFAGRASLAYVSLWAPNSEGWNPKWESRFNELYAFNPEKAKQLIKEAGYKPGQVKVKLLAFTEPGESEGPAIADAVAIYWKNVGINAEVEMHDWAKIRTMFRKKTIHCCVWPNIIGWPSDQGFGTFTSTKATITTTEQFIANLQLSQWRTLRIAPSCCSRSATTFRKSLPISRSSGSATRFLRTRRSSVTGSIRGPLPAARRISRPSSSSSKRNVASTRGSSASPLYAVQARCFTNLRQGAGVMRPQFHEKRGRLGAWLGK
jgi:hypothetical protein